jgi:hypothetical protein
MQMGRLILVLLVQVDILKTTAPVGMREPVTLHIAINQAGLHAMIYTAISGLFAIFYDGTDYFRVMNIPDNNERQILRNLGLDVYGSVDSIKSTGKNSSLASSDGRSNVV